MAQVRIPTVLRPSVGGNVTIDYDGETVGEIIGGIGEKFPDFLSQVVSQQGTMHKFVNIYVNDDDIRYLGGLATKVSPSDNLVILPAVAGGAA